MVYQILLFMPVFCAIFSSGARWRILNGRTGIEMTGTPLRGLVPTDLRFAVKVVGEVGGLAKRNLADRPPGKMSGRGGPRRETRASGGRKAS